MPGIAASAKTSTPGISVVFPCHNEAENIRAVIADARKHLRGLTETYELIIVDDGSTDDTAHQAQEVADSDSRITIARQPINLGYGHALRRGFATARMPLVCYVDGDGQFSLVDLPNLVDALGEHEFVLGFRIRRADPAHRTRNARLWQIFVHLVLGFDVRDLDCGFKLFRREALHGIELMAGRGAVISAELIAKLLRSGNTFAEVGVHHYPRLAGEQSGNSPKVVLNSFIDIIRLRWQLR